MQSFKMIFSGVTILQGVEFPIFPIDFAWALQQCSATALPVIKIINGRFGYCQWPWTIYTLTGWFEFDFQCSSMRFPISSFCSNHVPKTHRFALRRTDGRTDCNIAKCPLYHRRSQDFVCGCTFFLEKVDDFFSRRPQKTALTANLQISRAHAENVPKIDSCSAWGCTWCAGGALTKFSCKLR